ncbi:MAG: NAD(P)H-dependent oxidoreductase [Balneolaceae bacterium]
MNILVIVGHPRTPSLCASLAEAYAEGARAANMDVEVLNLGGLKFDPDVHPVSPLDQPLEPDLKHARKLIVWADHLTFVYPGWWGVGPARLRGFLDRILLPGFAFRERDDGRFEGLLGGRTAHLVTTLDMAPWVYRIIYRSPGHNAMKRSVLGFCGISTTRILAFGPVKDSTYEERIGWLEKAGAMGYSLINGARSRSRRVRRKLTAWLRALRLQFYPMTWMAYTVGALGATAVTGSRDIWLYAVGFAFLFLLEAATVFTNEWFDYESDRLNQFHGPFTGGSRVLVENLLSFRELGAGIVVTLILAGTSGGLLMHRLEDGLPLFFLLVLITVFALGYTVPPLKFSWRGLGELDVGITHSLGVLLIGFLLQGGAWTHPFPWLVSLPLFLSVLPAIILSGIPDLDADREAGKKTLAVYIGRKGAVLLAMALTVAAVLFVIYLNFLPALEGVLHGAYPWVPVHALILLFLLWRYWRRPVKQRIDGLMAISLAYIIWFGLIPLLNLM